MDEQSRKLNELAFLALRFFGKVVLEVRQAKIGGVSEDFSA